MGDFWFLISSTFFSGGGDFSLVSEKEKGFGVFLRF